MEILLKGKAAADKINAVLLPRIEALRAKGISPTLALVRVGNNDADLSYERGVLSKCAKLGIEVRPFVLPETCTQADVLKVIEEINTAKGIHGCLLFRPLPKNLDERAICEALKPEKDMDCITQGALAGVFCGHSNSYPPCTPQACVEILEQYGCELEGKQVVVLGRSLVVGKPVAMLLLEKNATVTICHSRTKSLQEICRKADILVAAIGRAKFVTADFVSAGQTIVDVGINVDEQGKLCGDVDFDQVSPLVKAISPVPGGVGAVTTSVLAKHIVTAAERTIN